MKFWKVLDLNHPLVQEQLFHILAQWLPRPLLNYFRIHTVSPPLNKRDSAHLAYWIT